MSNSDINMFRDEEFEEVRLTPEKVACLGMEFESDDARRAYFREELRKKLPELRQIEGFPIGEDDDIINLSDPPYYTACPNPWLNDFVAEWEKEKVELERQGKRSAEFEVNEPYSEPMHSKKNHPIYNAHSYHTKVPHDVVMRYLLHYTQPGDIIIDNFAGTGMTGVAVNEISYQNKYTFDSNGKWGNRKCILSDLSPFASFITANYTHKINKDSFKKAAYDIYIELCNELSWMYETEDNGTKGIVNYYIWSEVQSCPICGKDFVYWDAAVDFEKDIVRDEYHCPNCNACIKKKQSQKSLELIYDEHTNETYEQVKYIPVVVNYSINKKRLERKLNNFDREVILKVNNFSSHSWYPKNKMMGVGNRWGDTWRAGYHVGFTNVYNFYTKRNLIILSRFYELICDYKCDDRLKKYLLVWFTSCQSRLHIMNRYAPKHHRHVGPLANTMYISGTPTEISPFYFIKSKIEDNAISIDFYDNVINQVASASDVSLLKDNSIDYIFTDPPFGGNIMYSELNFLYESWLKVFTDNKNEAITNDTQKKGVHEYQHLMTKCFKEYYRLLKPGKWMTVEFSNTSASIWNSIRQSIQDAGFIITFVSDLNKGRGGLHGIYNVVAVNQDLAITCYKPTTNLINKISNSFDTSSAVWDFIDEYLSHIPVHLTKGSSTTAVVERNPKILYDRLISYYVQHGYAIPMDAQEFQKELRERFIERDGMFFTASQTVEYEAKKEKTDGVVPMALFISSEAEGIEWLKRELAEPQTYSEILPNWMKDMVQPKKGDVLPELAVILEENFIKDEDGKWRKPDAEKAADLELLRGKKLMKEFNLYLEQASKPKAKRMKDTRLEVLRYGFKECYKQKNYEAIVTVGDHIQESLLQEDEVLLQYYDIATMRV